MRTLRSFSLTLLAAAAAATIFIVGTTERSRASGNGHQDVELTNGVFAVGTSATTATSTLLGPLVVTDLSGFGTVFAFLAPASASCDLATSQPIGDILSGTIAAPGPVLFYRFSGSDTTISAARYFIAAGQRACVYGTDGFPTVGIAWSGFIP